MTITRAIIPACIILAIVIVAFGGDTDDPCDDIGCLSETGFPQGPPSANQNDRRGEENHVNIPEWRPVTNRLLFFGMTVAFGGAVYRVYAVTDNRLSTDLRISRRVGDIRPDSTTQTPRSSGSSQICEGVCPEGTTSAEVRAVVNGTFESCCQNRRVSYDL